MGPIVPSPGLRQRDPLSPYLFLVCAEGFSLLLTLNERRGKIHGCKVARGAPSISHLFSADSSLFFFSANEHEARVFKDCFTTYEVASRQ